ncbi:MAG: hypothetical protein AB1781_11175 [Pseudomonadota bacterium]
MQPAASSEKTVSKRTGNLANLTPWAKGVSGNPSGRKKIPTDVRDLAVKNTPRAFARIVELIESKDERVALMAAKEIIDRAYGKPAAADDDRKDASVTINIVRYADRDHASPQLETKVLSATAVELP